VIQNINLWKRYQLENELLTQKLRDTPLKLLLWHGTSETHPNVIIRSEEGFDIRFGREGCKWGKAVYFARNASYSNMYAYQDVATGYRKLLIGQVLIGNYIALPEDNELTKPPCIYGTEVEYDSVQGRAGDSDVYMVYANRKCYPRYLITYQ
jgi:hypothetical protein